MNSEAIHDRDTILVVEDDRAVRRSLEFSLDLEGFRVESFVDGDELLRRWQAGPCACLIVDLKLPRRDGLALIDELRRRRVTSPAILITSHPAPDTFRRAKAMSVSLVEKPLVDDRLMQEVRRLLAMAVATGGDAASATP